VFDLNIGKNLNLEMSNKRKTGGHATTREINLPLQMTLKQPALLGKTTTAA